jgi:uncharacterized protein GlcG (DUF336 family)
LARNGLILSSAAIVRTAVQFGAFPKVTEAAVHRSVVSAQRSYTACSFRNPHRGEKESRPPGVTRALQNRCPPSSLLGLAPGGRRLVTGGRRERSPPPIAASTAAPALAKLPTLGMHH